MSSTNQCGAPRVTELVWDIETCGTCTGSEGAVIRTGEAGDWRPDQLFVLALESDLMASFLRLARLRALTVLGYVSAAHLHEPDTGTGRSRICVHPCVVVGSPVDAERARGIMAEAYAGWVLAAMLKEPPRLELDVTTVEEQVVGLA